MYLYGAGGHSKVIIDILGCLNVQVKGLFDDNIDIRTLYGFEIQKGIKLIPVDQFPKLDSKLIISVGDNAYRAKIAMALDIDYGLAIHPEAIISKRVDLIDIGTVVLQGSIIQNNASVGKHVLINTAARVCNEAIIADYAHVSPQGVVSPGATVKEGTHIGAGAVVCPGITVGKWCKIGAGTIVNEDIPDGCTVVGNPMKIIKRMAITI